MKGYDVDMPTTGQRDLLGNIPRVLLSLMTRLCVGIYQISRYWWEPDVLSSYQNMRNTGSGSRGPEDEEGLESEKERNVFWSDPWLPLRSKVPLELPVTTASKSLELLERRDVLLGRLRDSSQWRRRMFVTFVACHAAYYCVSGPQLMQDYPRQSVALE